MNYSCLGPVKIKSCFVHEKTRGQWLSLIGMSLFGCLKMEMRENDKRTSYKLAITEQDLLLISPISI